MALLSKSYLRDARHFSRDVEDRMTRQLSHLSHEVGSISQALRRLGGETRHEAGHLAHEFADQAWQQGAIAAKLLGKQARKAGKAVREDPVPSIVAVAGFALFLNLVLGRKR